MSKQGRRLRADVPVGRVNRRAEQSSSYAVVGVCVVIALVIIGAAAWSPVSNKIRMSAYRGDALADVGGSAAKAGCQQPYELAISGSPSQTAEGSGSFVSAPPAYGPYSATSDGSVPTQFYDTSDRPALTDLVGDEYAGYTIVWYDSSISGSQLDELKAIAEKFDNSGDGRNELVVAPWSSADQASVTGTGALSTFPSGTHIAFTHWSAGGTGQTDPTKQAGIFQFCSSVSGSTLKAFMQAYPYTDSPAPGVLPTASTAS